MPFRPTPDYATDRDAEQAWNDAWAMVDHGDAEAAISIFERLYSTGRNGVAAALGFAWQKVGDLAKAEDFYRIAVFEHGDEDAKLGLCGILYARHVIEHRSADSPDIALARRMAEDIAHQYPYAHVLTGFFCQGLHQRLTDEGRSDQDWLNEARIHYQKAADAGLIVGMAQLATVLWRQRRYGRAIGLRLKIVPLALKLYARNHDHPRLIGVSEIFGPMINPKDRTKDSFLPLRIVSSRPSSAKPNER